VTITIVQRDLGPKFDSLADVEPLDVVDLRFAQAFPCLLQDRMQDRCVLAHAERQRHAMSLEIVEELELLEKKGSVKDRSRRRSSVGTAPGGQVQFALLELLEEHGPAFAGQLDP